MKIGYTFNKKEVLLEKNCCDEVIEDHASSSSAQEFKEFVEENIEHKIHIHSLEDLGIQIFHSYPALKYLKDHNKILYVIDKKPLSDLADEEYFDVLYHLALSENQVVKEHGYPTLRAKKGGSFPGRPSVSDEKINRIQELYGHRNKTIRQIADICGVSVGTAYKYATAVKDHLN